jgi:hypothetical protein
MKFYTRDLYRRCQSEDDAVLNVACEEWEQANEAYERHIQALMPQMAPQVREFADLLLHDAQVLAIGRHGQQLLMILHKDIPPRDVVILRYDLENEPAVEPFTDAPTDWSAPTDFLFDELNAVEQGDKWLYIQSIVFSNGWLMRLHFSDVQVTLAQPIALPPAAAAAPGFGVPKSA